MILLLSISEEHPAPDPLYTARFPVFSWHQLLKGATYCCKNILVYFDDSKMFDLIWIAPAFLATNLLIGKTFNANQKVLSEFDFNAFEDGSMTHATRGYGNNTSSSLLVTIIGLVTHREVIVGREQMHEFCMDDRTRGRKKCGSHYETWDNSCSYFQHSSSAYDSSKGAYQDDGNFYGLSPPFNFDENKNSINADDDTVLRTPKSSTGPRPQKKRYTSLLGTPTRKSLSYGLDRGTTGQATLRWNGGTPPTPTANWPIGKAKI